MLSETSKASDRAVSSPVCEAALRRYRFANVEVDFRAAELRRSGVRLRIQDQPLHLLAVLLSRPGELITREELRQMLWTENTFVDFDHGLNSAVKRLRDVLNDNPDNPRLIETVPRHGYRFIAPISEIEPTEPGTGAAGDRTVETSIGRADAVSVLPANVAGGSSNYGRSHWLVVALVITAVLAISVGFAALQLSRARALNRPHSKSTLAILPFHDLSEQHSGQSLSAGITQELITQLGKDADGVALLAHAPTAQGVDPGTIRVDTTGNSGADYVLEGSVRVQTAEARIAVQLIRVKDRRIVLTEAYDRALGDVLETQRQVGQDVARIVREHLKLREPGGS
jgi:DNA-binding winged helix-turn-helix (wHTH) protein/TolB-like protein